MIATEKLVSHILRNNADPGYVTKKLQSYEKLAQRRRELQRCREKARADYDAALNGVGASEAALRKECDHPDTHYHADPSGNRDSWSECNICGASV